MFKNISSACLLAVFLILSACAGRQPVADAPRPELRDMARPLEFGGSLLLPGGHSLDEGGFKALFEGADYILAGEIHTSACDHNSQAELLRKLAGLGLNPAVGLEMVSVDQQPLLDSFNRGEFSIDDLPLALNWKDNVGFPFELYRPVLEAAAEHGLPLYALNVPARIVRKVRIEGLDALDEQEREYLPKLFILSTDEQREQLAKVFDDHKSRFTGGLRPMPVLPGGVRTPPGAGSEPVLGRKPAFGPSDPAKEAIRLERFITAQSLWDSGMAESARRARLLSNRPVFIVAGAAHVQNGWGIALRIQAAESEARIISLLPWNRPMEAIAMPEPDPALAGKINRPDQDILDGLLPPEEQADAYYYCPSETPGRVSSGMVVGFSPEPAKGAVMVITVDQRSAAARSGLIQGDYIIKAGGRKLLSPRQMITLAAQYDTYAMPLELVVYRAGQELKVTLPPSR